jgi:iron complex outermembrane receptor protein
MGSGTGVNGSCKGVAAKWMLAAVVLTATPMLPRPARADSPPSTAELDRLPIEDLANIQISSVSKTLEPLSEAPAAIFVITHEDIVRSGATTLPEILRLAPNLQVAQVTASSFGISARGFNGTAADKLLVLIDGRSVYTPFANGVLWAAQDVPPEDIERIEVISGPGATLWGANAVNGVINIITRNSGDTEGGFVELDGGDLYRGATLQYGGRITRDLSFRLYADGADHGHDLTAAGANADDDWRRRHGGFRIDWTPSGDVVTLQGDLYRDSEDQPPPFARAASTGGNLLGRWTHTMQGGGALEIQAYYDDVRLVTSGQTNYSLRTYDLELQHSFLLGGRQQIVWGAGYRVTQDDFIIQPSNLAGAATEFFDPQKRTLSLGDLFAQDTIALRPSLKLTLGLKLEDDPYSSVEPLPNLRVSWKLTERNLLWAAVSRAVRAPSRLDRDFNENAGSQPFLTGGRFTSEDLVAYEVGYRTQPTPHLSASISLFYNDYRHLRSFEFSPVTLFPVIIENRLEGDTFGVEVWGAYQATDWWRLTAGANWLHKDLRFKPGSSGVGGTSIAGNDPSYQASLGSMMNLSHGVTLDLDLRDVGALPAPASPAYAELDGRLAWAISGSIEVALVGANLLNPRHEEFGSGFASVQVGASGVETARSLYLATRWRF